ncbi:hypothetical protein F511_35437 [Dorcoceras hygrometricum]|uniref:Uncharacterized protein n=1 Tax=Dorcoceras hygrometricum TaxID=472368 RepID=A0A2Z7D3T9_9LAMI|nr:hypothetical protein F511_35437 [Dorcoceras hygrometricum]
MVVGPRLAVSRTIEGHTSTGFEIPARILSSIKRRLPSSLHTPPPPRVAGIRSGRFDEENPFVQNSSVLLVQPDEGVSVLVVDRIGDYLPQSTEKSRVLVIPVGARHKCQQGIHFERPMPMVLLTKQTAPQRLTFVGQGIFSPIQIREIDWVTYFLPKIDPASKGKETLVVMNKPTPVEEHSQLVLSSAWDDVCALMDIFDEWMHFRKELIIFKLYELEEKSVAEHVANIKPTEPSINHDYMCIRILSKELREIAGLHRAQRIHAGLPIEAPKASIAGDDVGSNTLQLTWSSMAQSQIPALEFSTHKEHEQEVNRKLAQQDERIEEIVRTVGSTDNPTQLADPSVDIADTANTLGPDPTSEDNNADHQGPILHLSIWLHLRQTVKRTSAYPSSTAQNLPTPVLKELSYPDDLYGVQANLCGLKDTLYRFKDASMESKLRSMNSHIEQLMDTQTFLKLDVGCHKNIIYDKVDKLASNVTSSQTALETRNIRQLAGQQHQLTTDLDMVKLQLAELVEHLKRVGDTKKGEGGQSRPVDGSRRSRGEGASGEQSNIRGRGPSPRGGRGPSPGRYRPGDDSERYKYSKWF